MKKLILSACLTLVFGAAQAELNPYQPTGGYPGPSAGYAAHPPYTCVVNKYVDPVNGSANNPGTQAQPWQHVYDADDGYPNTPVAGECVNLAPGIYPVSTAVVLSHGGNANTPTGYVVYRSIVPGAAHLLAEPGLGSAGSADIFQLWAPYIIIDGLEIDGNHQLTVGSGINGCAYGGQPFLISHHFVAMNNIIHDLGGAGLSSCTADYISWQHNTVYNTSGTSPWQTSGISVWEPANVALAAPLPWDHNEYNIVIAHNLVYNNSEGTLAQNNQGSNGHTDGNGIIIDTTLGKNYQGPILVFGNLAYGNGGGGVHVFMSANVMVANNTAYNNYTDPMNYGTARGELSAAGSTGVTFTNNIGYAMPTATGITANNSPLNAFAMPGYPLSATVNNNIFWGAAPQAQGINLTGNMMANPMFSEPAEGYFRLRTGSPGLSAGVIMPFSRGIPDIGAE